MISVLCFDEYGNTIDYLTQWDVNRVISFEIGGLIEVNSMIAPIIHFYNKNSSETISVQSTISDNRIYAKVPNSLLIEDLTITVCIYLTNYNSTSDKETIVSINIPVRKRLKPDSYSYSNNISNIDYNNIIDAINSATNSINEVKNNISIANKDETIEFIVG